MGIFIDKFSSIALENCMPCYILSTYRSNSHPSLFASLEDKLSTCLGSLKRLFHRIYLNFLFDEFIDYVRLLQFIFSDFEIPSIGCTWLESVVLILASIM